MNMDIGTFAIPNRLAVVLYSIAASLLIVGMAVKKNAGT